MLVASMNPCPCGFYGCEDKKCTCSKKDINNYMGRISGPLLDRIDIQIEVGHLKYDELNSIRNIENSETIRNKG